MKPLQRSRGVVHLTGSDSARRGNVKVRPPLSAIPTSKARLSRHAVVAAAATAAHQQDETSCLELTLTPLPSPHQQQQQMPWKQNSDIITIAADEGRVRNEELADNISWHVGESSSAQGDTLTEESRCKPASISEQCVLPILVTDVPCVPDKSGRGRPSLPQLKPVMETIDMLLLCDNNCPLQPPLLEYTVCQTSAEVRVTENSSEKMTRTMKVKNNTQSSTNAHWSTKCHFAAFGSQPIAAADTNKIECFLMRGRETCIDMDDDVTVTAVSIGQATPATATSADAAAVAKETSDGRPTNIKGTCASWPAGGGVTNMNMFDRRQHEKPVDIRKVKSNPTESNVGHQKITTVNMSPPRSADKISTEWRTVFRPTLATATASTRFDVSTDGMSCFPAQDTLQVDASVDSVSDAVQHVVKVAESATITQQPVVEVADGVAVNVTQCIATENGDADASVKLTKTRHKTSSYSRLSPSPRLKASYTCISKRNSLDIDLIESHIDNSYSNPAAKVIEKLVKKAESSSTSNINSAPHKLITDCNSVLDAEHSPAVTVVTTAAASTATAASSVTSAAPEHDKKPTGAKSTKSSRYSSTGGLGRKQAQEKSAKSPVILSARSSGPESPRVMSSPCGTSKDGAKPCSFQLRKEFGKQVEQLRKKLQPRARSASPSLKAESSPSPTGAKVVEHVTRTHPSVRKETGQVFTQSSKMTSSSTLIPGSNCVGDVNNQAKAGDTSKTRAALSSIVTNHTEVRDASKTPAAVMQSSLAKQTQPQVMAAPISISTQRRSQFVKLTTPKQSKKKQTLSSPNERRRNINKPSLEASTLGTWSTPDAASSTVLSVADNVVTSDSVFETSSTHRQSTCEMVTTVPGNEQRSRSASAPRSKAATAAAAMSVSSSPSPREKVQRTTSNRRGRPRSLSASAGRNSLCTRSVDAGLQQAVADDLYDETRSHRLMENRHLEAKVNSVNMENMSDVSSCKVVPSSMVPCQQSPIDDGIVDSAASTKTRVDSGITDEQNHSLGITRDIDSTSKVDREKICRSSAANIKGDVVCSLPADGHKSNVDRRTLPKERLNKAAELRKQHASRQTTTQLPANKRTITPSKKRKTVTKNLPVSKETINTSVATVDASDSCTNAAAVSNTADAHEATKSLESVCILLQAAEKNDMSMKPEGITVQADAKLAAVPASALSLKRDCKSVQSPTSDANSKINKCSRAARQRSAPAKVSHVRKVKDSHLASASIPSIDKEPIMFHSEIIPRPKCAKTIPSRRQLDKMISSKTTTFTNNSTHGDDLTQHQCDVAGITADKCSNIAVGAAEISTKIFYKLDGLAADKTCSSSGNLHKNRPTDKSDSKEGNNVGRLVSEKGESRKKLTKVVEAKPAERRPTSQDARKTDAGGRNSIEGKPPSTPHGRRTYSASNSITRPAVNSQRSADLRTTEPRLVKIKTCEDLTAVSREPCVPCTPEPDCDNADSSVHLNVSHLSTLAEGSGYDSDQMFINDELAMTEEADEHHHDHHHQHQQQLMTDDQLVTSAVKLLPEQHNNVVIIADGSTKPGNDYVQTVVAPVKIAEEKNISNHAAVLRQDSNGQIICDKCQHNNKQLNTELSRKKETTTLERVLESDGQCACRKTNTYTVEFNDCTQESWPHSDLSICNVHSVVTSSSCSNQDNGIDAGNSVNPSKNQCDAFTGLLTHTDHEMPEIALLLKLKAARETCRAVDTLLVVDYMESEQQGFSLAVAASGNDVASKHNDDVILPSDEFVSSSVDLDVDTSSLLPEDAMPNDASNSVQGEGPTETNGDVVTGYTAPSSPILNCLHDIGANTMVTLQSLQKDMLVASGREGSGTLTTGRVTLTDSGSVQSTGIQAKRDNIIRELVSSEYAYVTELENVDKVGTWVVFCNIIRRKTITLVDVYCLNMCVLTKNQLISTNPSCV
jgi:hypothetical protein